MEILGTIREGKGTKVLFDFCHDEPKAYQKNEQEGQSSKEKAKAVRSQPQSLWQ